jgi:hypothetical protein
MMGIFLFNQFWNFKSLKFDKKEETLQNWSVLFSS